MLDRHQSYQMILRWVTSEWLSAAQSGAGLKRRRCHAKWEELAFNLNNDDVML